MRHPWLQPEHGRAQAEVLGQEGLSRGGSAWGPGAPTLAAPPGILGLSAAFPGLPGSCPRPFQPGNANLLSFASSGEQDWRDVCVCVSREGFSGLSWLRCLRVAGVGPDSLLRGP